MSRLVTWPKEGELAVQRFFEGGKAHSRYSDICDRVRPHHLHRPPAAVPVTVQHARLLRGRYPGPRKSMEANIYRARNI